MKDDIDDGSWSIVWLSSLEYLLEWFFKSRKATLSGVSKEVAHKSSTFEQLLLLVDISRNEKQGDDLPNTLLREMSDLAEEVMELEEESDYMPIQGFMDGDDMKRYPSKPYKLIIPE